MYVKLGRRCTDHYAGTGGATNLWVPSFPSIIAILHCVATSEGVWVWVQDTSDGRIMVAAGGGGDTPQFRPLLE